MKKPDIIQLILNDQKTKNPIQTSAKAYAPTNIALCKYWGKRDAELNLPVTSSLSISLAEYGATVQLEIIDRNQDEVMLNGKSIDPLSSFMQRLINFLNLFRAQRSHCFRVTIQSTVPIAAGLASSACGFASIVKALNILYGWNLTLTQQSILARLGSGSACRSLWDGFVEWHKGERADGMDCYAEPLNVIWPELNVGLLLIDEKEKSLSSREAMQKTIETNSAYQLWPQRVQEDLVKLKDALTKKDIQLLGETSESNAMMMHALMLTAKPPIQYSVPQTLALMQKIWNLRKEGINIYFTQDAGPNLKLLFLSRGIDTIKTHFPSVKIVQSFRNSPHAQNKLLKAEPRA